MNDVKFVPDRMVVGPHGQPVLESGYTEIGGIRFYPERLVVGRYGQPEIRDGHAVDAMSSASLSVRSRHSRLGARSQYVRHGDHVVLGSPYMPPNLFDIDIEEAHG